jgi:hypothetical protein
MMSLSSARRHDPRPDEGRDIIVHRIDEYVAEPGTPFLRRVYHVFLGLEVIGSSQSFDEAVALGTREASAHGVRAWLHDGPYPMTRIQ